MYIVKPKSVVPGWRQLRAVDSMYPVHAGLVNAENWKIPVEGSSVYGYVVDGWINDGETLLNKGQVFAMSWLDLELMSPKSVSTNFCAWIVTRLGFKVPYTVTKPEAKGRLTYIDGCSDSLLVYPPRKGDGSLSHLHFPDGIDQSWHTHPSIRMGYVLNGEGYAEYKELGKIQRQPLKAGSMFMLPEHMSHRFCTGSKSMDILAYHPDGDWGPEDHSHTMLNRTYVGKQPS